MARDKLITIRIEGEKRQAFTQLAKSQNTDTASLLYDFISQCLDGRIDIKLVTGKGNRLDNQLDTNRLDKLEATTQEIDSRLDTIAKKLTDWVEAFSDRLSDCDRELSEKITSLEHRLNALSIQLDSQRIDSEIGDMEPVATVETAIDTVETAIETVEAVTDTVESVTDTVEAVDDTVESDTMEPDSIVEPVTGSIGPVRGDSIGKPCKGMNAADAYRYVTSKGVKVSQKTLSNWVKLKEIPITDKGDKVSEYLVLRGKLYYPSTD